MNRFKENMIRQLTTHEGLRLKPCCCGLDEKNDFCLIGQPSAEAVEKR
jgi:hypothetical protein